MSGCNMICESEEERIKEAVEEATRELRLALEEIGDHDTHTVYGNRGNAYKMSIIAKKALE